MEEQFLLQLQKVGKIFDYELMKLEKLHLSIKAGIQNIESGPKITGQMFCMTVSIQINKLKISK